jgi:predicted ATPase/DNA-binding SARP family transcriptional activator/tetratricopeptide (TPR) repeat protein
VQVSILGPVEVSSNGRPVPVGGSRVRRLLTRLALDADRPVGQHALADAVWGQDVPAEVPNALQSLVSRLRRALGDASTVVATPAGGYRLAIAAGDIDAARFERGVEDARAVLGTDPAAALAALDAALQLWRGEPLADLDPDDPATAPDLARLEGLHAQAVEARLEAMVRTGRAGSVVRDLSARVEAEPTDERAAGLLMTALVASGRPADALVAYDRARSALADTLGVDPSAELQAQHLAILRRDAGDEPAAAARGNLPAPVSSFLGRDADLTRLGGMLRRSRLVTLVGPGGSGKTRLAVEASRLAAPLVPGGAWLVELAKVTDPADVPTAVVDAVGAWDAVPFDRPVEHRATPQERLVAALRSQPTLLLLDNCEHVVDAAAALADSLLSVCPDLRVLATSREPLSVSGETLCPVPPLAHDTADLDLDVLGAVPAVALFVDRAQAVDPSFTLVTGNAAAVAEICRRLDGLPLALELAAARSRTLPVTQIADRLGDRFRLLTGGSRTALPRHRTLQAVVEWSWGLLSDHERDLAERLAVFPAGVSPEAARFVVSRAGGDERDADELVAALVDKSLLQLRDGPRYRMLETIREYGTDRLADRGVLAEAREVHAAWFSDLVQRVEPLLRGRDQLPWIALSLTERDNVLAALQYLCDRGDADRAVRLATGIAWLWTLRGEHAAVTTWFSRALAVPGGTWDTERITALGLYAMNVGATEGRDAGRKIVDEHSEYLLADPAEGDPPMLTLTRTLLPIFLGDVHEAQRRVAKGLAVTSDPWARAMLFMFSGYAEENSGDISAMRVNVRAAQEAFEALGERFGLASVLEARGRLLTLDGDLDGAIDSYSRSAELQAELGAEEDSGQAWLWTAQLYARRGDLDEADAAVASARARFARDGSWLGRVLADSAASMVARERGEYDRALALARSAQQRYRERPLRSGPAQLSALCLVAEGLAQIARKEFGPAREVLGEARTEAVDSSDMPVVAMVTVGFAALAVAGGDLPAAADLLGSADAIRGNPDSTDPDVVRITAALSGDPSLVQRREQAAAGPRDKALSLMGDAGRPRP